MSDYRFYIADSGGATHRTLQMMEAAGQEIFSRFKILDALADKITPVVYTLDGNPIGLSVMPNLAMNMGFSRHALEQKATIVVAAPVIEMARSAMERHGFLGCPPAIDSVGLGSRAEEEISALTSAEVVSALKRMVSETARIGIDRNIVSTILWHSTPTDGRPDIKSDKVVLTVGGHSFYPEAHRAFSTWILKFPPYIEIYGNDYSLPDCRRVEAEKLNELLAGADFDDFPHDHHRARERILGLLKFEMTQYVQK